MSGNNKYYIAISKKLVINIGIVTLSNSHTSAKKNNLLYIYI